MPELSNRVKLFTDSVIRRMTRICNQYDAINLSQGFPDFDPPKVLTDRLAEVAHQGPHQYSVTFGAQNLREALAKKQGKAIGYRSGKRGACDLRRNGSDDERHDDDL